MARRSHSAGDGQAKVEVRRRELKRVSDALHNVNNVTREEFNAAADNILANLRSLEVQFQRIAQMQVELDELKRTVAKLAARK